MSIALIIGGRDVAPLKQSIERHLEGAVPMWKYPDIPSPELVKMAVLWKHPPHLLSTFTGLELASLLGAGVEHILNDASLPGRVRVSRIVDERLFLIRLRRCAA